MFDHLPKELEKLVEEFRKLPGVSKKTAEKFVFHIINNDVSKAQSLINAINDVKTNIKKCSNCNNLIDQKDTECHICLSESRNHKTICVVSFITTLLLIEKTQKYNGMYYVLEEELNLKQSNKLSDRVIHRLKNMVKKFNPEEVIIATNPNIEGELTAEYIKSELKSLNVKVSRIAYGLPMGSSIDYADDYTLTHSLENRKEFK